MKIFSIILKYILKILCLFGSQKLKFIYLFNRRMSLFFFFFFFDEYLKGQFFFSFYLVQIIYYYFRPKPNLYFLLFNSFEGGREGNLSQWKAGQPTVPTRLVQPFLTTASTYDRSPSAVHHVIFIFVNFYLFFLNKDIGWIAE